METTKNQLSPYITNFFNRLSNYLDTPLYFFGSVQRDDFFTIGSDIDVDIFTNNEKSTILQLQSYLNIPRDNFKKVVWKINVNKQLAHGYKLMYKEPENNLIVEFSIYNEKYKPAILYEHRNKFILPFYATYLLIMLKFCFYTLTIIPPSVFRTLKRFVLNTMVNTDEEHFVVLDVKNSEK